MEGQKDSTPQMSSPDKKKRYGTLLCLFAVLIFLTIPFYWFVIRSSDVYSSNWAIVIGIESYYDEAIPKLKFAKADALSIYDWLIDEAGGEYGKGSVLLLVDGGEKQIKPGSPAEKIAPTRHNIEWAISSWLRSRCQPEDRVLFYFAGQATVAANPNQEVNNYHKYLVPIDSEADKPESTAIAIDTFSGWMDAIQAKQVIYILDTSFSGRGKKWGKVEQENIFDYEFARRLTLANGRSMVLASGFGAVAKEDAESGHGLLTANLLTSLREGKADLGKLATLKHTFNATSIEQPVMFWESGGDAGSTPWLDESIDQAASLVQKALRRTQTKVTPRVVELKGILGRIHRLQGKFADAENTLTEALDMAKQLGMTVTTLNVQSELGIIAYQTKEYIDAQQFLTEAAESARTLRLPNLQWEPSYYLGLTHRELGQTEKAVQYLTESVESLKQTQGKLAENIAAGFDDKKQVFLDLLQLLSKLGRKDEAFKYTGLMKAQELSNVTARSHPTLQEAPAKQALLEKAQSFQGRELELTRLLQEELNKPPPERRQELIEQWQEKLDQTRIEFEDFTYQLEREHFDLYKLVEIEPDGFYKLQERLKEDEAFIEPIVLPDRLVIFVVRGVGDKDIQTPLIYREQKVSKADIDKLLRRMRDGLENPNIRWAGTRRAKLIGGVPDSQENPTEASQKLYELLIQPILNELEGIQTLIISPSGRLRYIPFQALYDGKQFLIEKYQIAVLTLAGAFEEYSKNRNIAQAEILAFSNPDGSLPAAESEVKALEKMWSPIRTFYGTDATKFNLKSNLRGVKSHYRILHFATHGALLNDNPRGSYLLFAGDDNRLSFREIPSYPLQRTYLATLSACETALGDKGEGSEISGLAYQFEKRGAGSVIASLWKVNDASTADFMTVFYSHLKKPGVSKAESLQAAQLKLLSSNGDTQHPYFWAPFILIGDWR